MSTLALLAANGQGSTFGALLPIVAIFLIFLFHRLSPPAKTAEGLAGNAQEPAERRQGHYLGWDLWYCRRHEGGPGSPPASPIRSRLKSPETLLSPNRRKMSERLVARSVIFRGSGKSCPRKLRWRFFAILTVVVLCVVGIIGLPTSGEGLLQNLRDRIRLGLDLRGGMHLILQVNTGDALTIETDQSVDRIKRSFSRAGDLFWRDPPQRRHPYRRFWKWTRSAWSMDGP